MPNHLPQNHLPHPRTLTVYKQNALGEVVWHYSGQKIVQTPTLIVLEAIFGRDDYSTDYHTFKRGDRMLEWFYSDRWYNIFELHHRQTNQLEGWYCNITRPAIFDALGIHADDLAIDVMVYPDGNTRILDMDEFAALPIAPDTRAAAELGLQQLLQHIGQCLAPFDLIKQG